MDTATRLASVALVEDGQSVGMTYLSAWREYAGRLPESLASLLKEARWEPADLDLITVTIGPGSFTGIRIALGIAKGIALASAVSLIGISTLAALVASIDETSYSEMPDHRVVPLLDARRGALYAGIYRWRQQRLSSDYPDAILSPEALARLVMKDQNQNQNQKQNQKTEKIPSLSFVGRADLPHREDLCDLLEDRISVTWREVQQPDPVAMARLALRLWKHSGSDDAAGMTPLYLKTQT